MQVSPDPRTPGTPEVRALRLPDGGEGAYILSGAAIVRDDGGRGARLVRAGEFVLLPPDQALSETLRVNWELAAPYFESPCQVK